MTSLTPPSLDEIHEIVDRRRTDARRRNRLAFTGTAVVVAAAAVVGIRGLTDTEVSGIANEDGGGEPTPAEGPKPRPAITDPVLDADNDALADDEQSPGDDNELFNYGAFYGAGYGYTQSMALSEVWQVGAFDAKVMAGALIVAGRQDEVTAIAGPPIGAESRLDDFTNSQDDWELDILLGAYWGAGYGVEQSEALAEAWEVDVFTAKADAGYDVLTGDTTGLDELIGSPTGIATG